MSKLTPPIAPAMRHAIDLRPIESADFDAWLPLWAGYNAFYGRAGETALPQAVTETTWQRFLDPTESVFCLIASHGDRLVGLAHYLFHRSTTRLEPVCYLQDLFTVPSARGGGVGRALIEGVGQKARARGIHRVYWQTHEANAAGRSLYDRVARHHGFLVYALDV
jgi:GNAT superfamily N-acetyltransferase